MGDRSCRSAGLAAVILLASGVARGQSIVQVPAPGFFQLRADLVGVHPRLHFTAADVPALRAKAQGGAKFFADQMKANFAGRMGAAGGPTGDWLDYLYGLWGQLSMDLLWLVEPAPGNAAYADTAKKWALGYARDTTWRDASVVDDLVPNEITTGMALTYDILYEQLTASERQEIRTALFDVVEKMYAEFLIGDYWTQDFQNNHMHNRISGLAHASIAMLGDDPGLDVQRHADLAYGAFSQLRAWMSEDGSTHEGPGYWDYGYHWVTRDEKLFEHVTGVTPAATGHDREVPYYRLYLLTPGMLNTFAIADSGDDGPADNLEATLPSIARFRDGRLQSFLLEQMQTNPDGFYQQVAWGLLWYDPTVTPEPYTNLPLSRVWPDLDMISVRGGWDANAVGVVFKSGPPGGHKMQQLRGNGGTDWVNIAHDHPDQNHFLLWAFGKQLAEDDGYPANGAAGEVKLTSSHNTILIDGEGGPREATDWYQPFDYAQTAFLRDVAIGDTTAYALGDASRLYTYGQRVLRHFVFVEGQYVLVIDDLVGAGTASHTFDWRLHKNGSWAQASGTEFNVDDGAARLNVRFLDPAAVTSSFFPAAGTAVPGLSVTTTGNAAQFLVALIPQNNGAPVVTSEKRPATNGLAIRAQIGGRSDLFGAASGGGPLSVDDVAASGTAFLVARQGASLSLALVARGTSLAVGGSKVLASDQPANLVWRPSGTGGRLEVEPPYRAAGFTAALEVGGLSPGGIYRVSPDGETPSAASANGSGVLAFALDVQRRRTIDIEETTSGDGGVPADAGPGDAGTTDAGPTDAGAPDGGPTDAGLVDAGPGDSGSLDAGTTDAGPTDSGATDTGVPSTDGGFGPGVVASGSCGCASAASGWVDSAWLVLGLPWARRMRRGGPKRARPEP